MICHAVAGVISNRDCTGVLIPNIAFVDPRYPRLVLSISSESHGLVVICNASATRSMTMLLCSNGNSKSIGIKADQQLPQVL